MTLDDAIELSIANLSCHGLSDISDANLEKALMERFSDRLHESVRKSLKKDNVYEMEFKPAQYMLSPKNRYIFDYRKAAIIEPECLVKYTALVLMAAEQIENNRIPVSEKVVFSARYMPQSPDLFNADVNYSSWRERTKELAESSDCAFIVSCDIAAFYDRVNIHRVESTLDSIGVDQKVVKKINDLLLFWSRKDSYGLPVGNAASRILAEAALIDIDQYLLSENIRFTRYVDDYRLFAPDIVTAQRWMNKLNTRLFRDGLMLNTGKTRLAKAKKSEDGEVTEGDDSDEEAAERVLKEVTKLTGGYNRIARRFIMPSEDKHHLFKAVEIDAEIESLMDEAIIEFRGVQQLVIACLVQKSFSKLIQVAELCSRYMYSLDYFVDMLLKNKAFIPVEQRDEIADFFARLSMDREFYSFEWHQASVAKLLSDDAYFRKNALIEIFRSSSKDMPSYPSVVALDGLEGRITRSEFRTMREWFDRCDDWEKRRLMRLSNSLPTDERKAWARAVRPSIRNDVLGGEFSKVLANGKDPV
ncbi:hypothetical protein J2T60_000522 [Natronospira proteinivora]|uniref:Reverse transcriptase domain-containing protein n=1 Tax=Natronospira proteinivora TaxID=1807133 RepID=A0ABT1G5H7_9GAMM|nr:RNA-directed DNA polymerase [Natronospira proteinivora]MCP1726557.1 hypothetical protein [Natronospira proteinivora]